MSRRSRLVARATETARQPEPSRLRPEGERRSYRIVSFSLYSDHTAVLDAVQAALEAAGLRKANRSAVVQEAILCLQEALDAENATSPEQIADVFRRNALRRRRAHLISVQR